MSEIWHINITPGLEHRFWSKVQKGDGCWEWTGRPTKAGYADIRVGGRKVLVHRLSYLLHNGTLDPDLDVLHRCDNRLCVRPDHLFVGTQADNVRDMLNKGRHNWQPNSGKRPFGEHHWCAKLTEQQVREIRQTGNALTQSGLALQFGVTRATIGKILRGNIWREVDVNVSY